jgi:hypothetical protein
MCCSTLQALDVSVQTVFHHAREQSVMVHTHCRTHTLLAVLSLTLAVVGPTRCAGQEAALSGESQCLVLMHCLLACWGDVNNAMFIAVLHQDHARLTRQVHPYLLKRGRGKDGEAMGTLWHQMSLQFWRKIAVMTPHGLEAHHCCCLSASSLPARYPVASVQAPPTR